MFDLPIITRIPKLPVHSCHFSSQSTKPKLCRYVAQISRRLKHIYSGSQSRLILISSDQSGEGKSTLAFQLAAYFAKNNSCLLIDTDSYNSGIRRDLHLESIVNPTQKPPSWLGLNNYLNTQSPFENNLFQSKDIGFDLLPAGHFHRPLEISPHQTRFKQLFSTARQQYRWIIIDTPPLKYQKTALDLLPETDSFLLVFNPMISKLTDAQQHLDIIKQRHNCATHGHQPI